ncbi:3-oxoadipate enol-lactonase [Methylobacterium phyllostachyos]|uniref:3-oxoadipate enol-lactonase n=1 Tax=Methylobacterium phyllostachyos TaxID=582672 RepID=A0A1H0C7X0_9HYPH|nr:3-oxoadipate enol-lactonase [Methylobacterium phyllostachyos]SDN53949.1 3-oxoadipate enol-lactonase [Methylobacterium phyllostachyos]
MAFAECDGVRLHYRADGDPANAALVLSNSLGASLDMWAPQVEPVARRFRLIRYDARGHGQSAVPPGPYTIAQLGRDVIGLLDHLGIGQAHFAGVSMGGLTGQWLALNHPERLRRLALCNTAATIGPPENWTSRAEAVRADGVGSIADTVAARWLTADYAAAKPELAATLRRMLAATASEGYAAACLAVRDADFRADLARIAVPTLVIAGTHDAATPAAAGRFLADHIPGAQYRELSGAHLTNLEDVARFNEALLAFFGEAPAS